jgi:hypothetical protein
MKTVNSKVRTFFMSLGACPKDSKDPEPISGGMIRLRKGAYLHLPMIKVECRSKQQFIDEVNEIAEQLWERIKEAGL